MATVVSQNSEQLEYYEHLDRKYKTTSMEDVSKRLLEKIKNI